jgi:hypothetical protein
MLLLTSTSDIIRIVTGAAADVDVHASWVDNNAGTITPGRTNTTPITTAATTTVVGSPAASTQRNVKALFIHNTHATVATTVTVQHFDGTTSIDIVNCTLLPDEHLNMQEDGTWVHRDAQLGAYTYTVPARGVLGMTNIFAETIPREICPEVNTVVPTASGTLFMQAIYLYAGQLVSNITVSSATTAAGTPTGGRVGLYSANRALLAQSADQTTTAWAANTVKTLAMLTPYRVPTSGLYYIGIYMTATTVMTMKGGTAKTGGQLASSVPILHGTSTTGLTTTLPDPAAAITGGLVTIYAGVS